MVKIVGQDATIVEHATCRNCGGINEFVPADVRKLHEGRDISGCYEVSFGFNCVQCGKEITTRSW